MIRSLTLFLLVCFPGQHGASGLKEAPEDPGKALSVEIMEQGKRIAAEYQIYLGDDREEKLTLHSQPVLRWSNPVAVKLYGGLFIWTAKGRPEAIVSIHKWYNLRGQPIDQEFHSLSLGELRAERDNRQVWSPSTAGIELKPIPGAPEPDVSAQHRLRQMRSLAREFKVTEIYGKRGPTELRLLSQPIYRYESTSPDLLDGALFGFVQATDPDVFLLIEARRKDSGHQWQFGLARMTSYALQVRYKNQEVWKVFYETLRQSSDRQATYTIFRGNTPASGN